MADLIALTPCKGLLPLTIGTVTLTEVVPDRLTLIAPFRGQEVEGFPAPNQTTDTMMWVGQGQALMWGDVPEFGDRAAVTDQSDAYAVVRLEGTDVVAVLARLVPIDLRARVFPLGQTARTLVGHMMASVTRRGDVTFDVMVMRSMAATLVHELSQAATGVALR